LILLPLGTYRYETRRPDAATLIEEATVLADRIRAVTRESAAQAVHRVDAAFDPSGSVHRLEITYTSSLFKRDAVYRADDEVFRATIRSLAGQSDLVVKRGRFGEVEVAEMAIFRAWLIARVRARGQMRWTGRVAVIEAHSLVAASIKQSCRAEADGRRWLHEKRMGEAEELVFDADGRLVTRRDRRGREDRLLSFTPASMPA
jgi:hypothetical protein